MNDLEGRTAIVTGAASGIGYAVAKALHRDGMQVLLGDIDAERIADATDAIGDTERGCACSCLASWPPAKRAMSSTSDPLLR
jgi:3-oxoacyl-[acyl-carrier protein] reductase